MPALAPGLKMGKTYKMGRGVLGIATGSSDFIFHKTMQLDVAAIVQLELWFGCTWVKDAVVDESRNHTTKDGAVTGGESTRAASR